MLAETLNKRDHTPLLIPVLGIGSLVLLFVMSLVLEFPMAAGLVMGTPLLILLLKTWVQRIEIGAWLMFATYFLIPFANISPIPYITPLTLVAGAAFLVFLLRASDPSFQISKAFAPSLMGILIYMLYAKVTLLANDYYGNPDLMTAQIKNTIATAVMLLLITRWSQFEKTIHFVLVLLFISGVFGILQELFGKAFYIQPFFGYSTYELEVFTVKGKAVQAIGLEAGTVWFSRTMLFGFVLCFGKLISIKKQRFFWAAASAFFGHALLLPEIRSSNLAAAFAVALIIVGHLWKKGTLKRYLPLLILSSIPAMGFILFNLLEIGSSSQSSDLNLSLATRVFTTSSLLKMYSTDYLFGIGYGLPGYSLQVYGFFPMWVYDILIEWGKLRGAHNIILDHLAGGGPILLLMFFGMIGITTTNFLIAFKRAKTPTQESILLALAAFMLPFVFTSTFHNYIYDLLYFFLFGFSYLVRDIFVKPEGVNP